jgi:hypothetical protein
MDSWGWSLGEQHKSRNGFASQHPAATFHHLQQQHPGQLSDRLTAPSPGQQADTETPPTPRQQANPLQAFPLWQQQGRRASPIAKDNRPPNYLNTRVYNSTATRLQQIIGPTIDKSRQ